MLPSYRAQIAARRTEVLGLNNRRRDKLEPLTPELADAVQQLKSTECSDPRRITHLIPARATVCIYCGYDAADINRLELPA